MLNSSMVWRIAVTWNVSLKRGKMFENTFLTIFLKQEMAGTSFFAMVLPICCVLDGAEKVAPTQFQLPDTYHHEC